MAAAYSHAPHRSAPNTRLATETTAGAGCPTDSSSPFFRTHAVMPRPWTAGSLVALLLSSIVALAAAAAPKPAVKAAAGAKPAVSEAAAEFFETRVRPVLAEHCYKCHSADAKALKGGLRLDSR